MANVNLHVNLLGTISSTVLYTHKISNISIRYNNERQNISIFIFNRNTQKPVIKLYFSVYELTLLFNSNLHDMEIIGKGKRVSITFKNDEAKKDFYDHVQTYIQQLNKFFNNVLGKSNANYDSFFYWEDVYLNRETFIEIVQNRSNYLNLPTQSDRDRESKRQQKERDKELERELRRKSLLSIPGLTVIDGEAYIYGEKAWLLNG